MDLRTHAMKILSLLTMTQPLITSGMETRSLIILSNANKINFAPYDDKAKQNHSTDVK